MAEKFPLTFPISFSEEIFPIFYGIQTQGEGKIFSFGSGKITLYRE